MAFHLTHRVGNTDAGESDSNFYALLEELDDQQGDVESGCVAVTHGGRWCVSVFRGGYVVFENLQAGGAQHMTAVPGEKIVALWRLVAHGDIAALKSEAWLPGIDSAALRKIVADNAYIA